MGNDDTMALNMGKDDTKALKPMIIGLANGDVSHCALELVDPVPEKVVDDPGLIQNLAREVAATATIVI